MPITDEQNIHELYIGLLDSIEQDFSTDYLIQKKEDWVYFSPKESQLPSQGWKIHVSVVPPQGMDMLQRIVHYLHDNQLHWKVLSTYKQLERSSYGGVSLPQTGKVVTIYINKPEDLEKHLKELHQLTTDFKGPIIPTDKRFQHDSCVYFRYGAFKDMFFYDPYTSIKTYALYQEDKGLVEDKRVPGHYKPDWIQDPFPHNPKPDPSSTGENAFVKRNIKMLRLLKQAGKGGVYCIQTAEYAKCLLKEGRANILYDKEQRSVKNRLENEYRVLKKLSSTGFTPKPIEVFDYSGNTYLITEYIEGMSLREYIERMHYFSEYNLDIIANITKQLEQMVTTCHQYGVIIRDLSPNNVIINDQLEAKLIDLELSLDQASSSVPFTGYTPGYIPIGYEWEARDRTDFDQYALGAIYYFICTSLDPYLELDSVHDAFLKWEQYLASSIDHPLLHLGQEGLTRMKQAVSSVEKTRYKDNPVYQSMSITDPDTFLTYTDTLASTLKEKMNFESSSQLMATNALSSLFHPVTFNYGLSGIAHFMKEAAIVTGNKKHLQTAIDMAQWMLTYTPFEKSKTPVGLYFGYGYLPWLLTDLSVLAQDNDLEEQAQHVIAQLVHEELTQYNISHGSAGLGLMLLHMYKQTQNPLFLSYAKRMADHLISGAERKEVSVLWKTMEKKKSFHPLGYSHGVAGIGYFLAALYDQTQQPVYLQLVQEILSTLIHTALPNHSQHGLLWQHSYGNQSKAWTFWCNGSAGVAKFLLLVHRLGLDERAKEYATLATNAVMASHIYGSNCQCHGLAGNGDFLLDANLTLHSEKIHQKVDEYVKKLESLAIRKDRIPLWAVEDKKTLSPDFMTGYTGVYSFLLRYHFDLPQPLSYQVDSVARGDL